MSELLRRSRLQAATFRTDLRWQLKHDAAAVTKHQVRSIMLQVTAGVWELRERFKTLRRVTIWAACDRQLWITQKRMG